MQGDVRGLVRVLLGEWSFEAGEGLESVTEEMRVLVAGQAALVPLGRPLAELPRLRAFNFYPGDHRAEEERLTPQREAILSVLHDIEGLARGL